MKKLISTVICAFCFFMPLVAQKNKPQPVVVPDLPVDISTGLYSYTKVIELPGISKNDLYQKAYTWANSYYKNPADVIREKNPEEGMLLIKARYKIFNEADKKGVITAAGDVMYSLTIALKDGKYKYEITKINWQQKSYYPIEKWKDTSSAAFSPSFPYYLKQTDEKIKEVIAALEKSMQSEMKNKKDDW